MLTAAQRKGLLALPRDGSRLLNGHGLAKALDSLCLYHPELAISEFGNFGPRGGRYRAVRLTETGRDYIAEHLPELSCA